MITRKALLLNTFVVALASYPHTSVAEGFSSAEVLEWNEESQKNYFQTSVTMIGIVATQVEGKEQIAECIDSWFGGPVVGADQRAEHIREVMKGTSQQLRWRVKLGRVVQLAMTTLGAFPINYATSLAASQRQTASTSKRLNIARPHAWSHEHQPNSHTVSRGIARMGDAQGVPSRCL